jgi:hypothetical protein
MHSIQQIPAFTRASGKASRRTDTQSRLRRPSDVSKWPRFRSVESAKLIEHQMYFWGQDVLHPAGNLLIAAGCQDFRREDCPHAVRCYQLETAVATITLHSTGVSLQPKDGTSGVVYLRPTHRLYHLAAGIPPLPYQKDKDSSLRRLLPKAFPPALSLLLALVRAYERWAAHHWEPGSRLAAWRDQRATATKGIRWLPPEDSLRWLDACLAARKAVDPAHHNAPEAFRFPPVS